jgi:hypothetical protein
VSSDRAHRRVRARAGDPTWHLLPGPYVFLVVAHDRRRILRFNVTARPPDRRVGGKQLREAFPFDLKTA